MKLSFNLFELASQSGEAVHAQLIALKDQNRGLQEENQLLKFKMEVLLDMVRKDGLNIMKVILVIAIDHKIGFARKRDGATKVQTPWLSTTLSKAS